MRKAFDANVPKLKPRLRAAVGEAAATVAVEEKPSASAQDRIADNAGSAISHEPLAPSPSTPPLRGSAQDERSRGAPSAAPLTPTLPALRAGTTRSDPAADAAGGRAQVAPVGQSAGGEGEGSRKERLDAIKRRVADAAKPAARIEPVPADPARAAESVLALVRDLEAELAAAREREDALRADLDASRRELGRAAGEARAATERLAESDRQLEEKRAVLSELLAEMNALEAERDESVRRAQALAALDEERARALDEVTRRADDEARLRAEREAEVERLSEELRTGAADAARLRAALAEVTRERDALAGDLERTARERDELAAAKRALEQVHAALAQARARLG